MGLKTRLWFRPSAVGSATRQPDAPDGHAATRPVSQQPSDDATIRACTRLLRMVHELHKAGYQRLRISPGMSPSGVHWRCTITHAANVAADGHSPISDSPRQAMHYSSASGEACFGWDDAVGRTARQLAALFIERCPTLAAAGAGRDWRYAGWLTEMLGRAEQGRSSDLPVLFADYAVDRAEILPPPP